MAIDESNIDNGCMKVIPGSHKESVSFRHRKDQREKLVLNQMVDDERVDLGKSSRGHSRCTRMAMGDELLSNDSNGRTWRLRERSIGK